jgi:hydrogenase maturation protease
VHRLDIAAAPLPIDWSPSSTHAFGLGETVELARNLDRLPRRLVLYLVEGEKFDVGDPLSPAVADAVNAVAENILTEVSAFLTVDQLYCSAADA